jgi:biotin carboxyl carrier protein
MAGKLVNYRTLVNERSYMVSVEQTGKEKFTAKINGEAFECEMVRSDEISAWVIKADDYEIVAYVTAPQKEKVDVWIAGIPFSASVESLDSVGHIPRIDTAKRHQVAEIRALMPGRITSILVKENDNVNIGTPLLILEAMKMQNEIVAPVSGKVKSIHVGEATAVKKDSVLIVIE